jgi:hypothetical protein
LADVERSIYFYKVEMAPDGGDWQRTAALRGLDGLTGDDRVLSLGDDNYAWAQVDRIPTGPQSGRLRFFRDRRSNLPGFAQDFDPQELPIPEEAGLIEPTHVVLAGDGLIAAEYNHFAPRIPSQFAALLRRKLGLRLTIGTYAQGSIIEQLDRLDYIQLLEFSVVSTPELEDELRNQGDFADAVASLAHADGGKRLNLRLSGDKDSPGFTEQARQFAKRLLGLPGAQDGHTAKVLRVTGLDPASGSVEPVDLLKQKLVRRVDLPKTSARSKVLDVNAAYTHIEEAVAEVRQSDLPHAAVIS